MSSIGGKSGGGVHQAIINQIPPHDVYCAPFLGDDAIMRRIKPAERSIGIEIDPAVAAGFADGIPPHKMAAMAIKGKSTAVTASSG